MNRAIPCFILYISGVIVPLGIAPIAWAADSCKPVDMRGPKLGEARNQGDIGWCYAFSTADLLSHKTGVRISAADIAVGYITKNSTRNSHDERIATTNGGYPTEALDAALAYGLCREEQFRSDPSTRSDLQWFVRRDIAGQLLRITRQASNQLDSIRNVVRPVPSIFSPSAPIEIGYISGTCPQAVNIDFSEIAPLLKFSEQLNVLLQSQKIGTINALRNQACRDRIHLGPQLQVHSEMLSSRRMIGPSGLEKRRSFMSTLGKQLDAGNIVEVTYSPRFMLIYPDHANHSSTIVGRRPGPRGECEYLIRNTAGSSCEHYRYPCESGHIWVPASKLEENIIGYSYLE